ncbi:Na+/proline symporter/signal transduction histidine kinase [Azospirillum lipoferum]|uniref:histidine kinase n=1 Tax=Azospirillum lipoferum TaxID=193 RepID=A0A5A9GUV6_AZOLI|nr:MULTISPECIES: sensor histidine kinase [Azospirillum]KAA0598190.1 histidine kinase [Azospirillum lipoferum]MCP1609832.1 Na+/proline symporter/signal transduction histidine kinase [Azospirillum lipoferum]MDW5534864.1 sensor histidine kinase [Azospirillum sp. NL1]
MEARLDWATVLIAALLYLTALFAIAHWADRREAAERSVIASPTVFALSLGVYCTTWTFYGSVGRAATLGIGFLPVYLGPTLLMLLAPLVLRKILRIAKAQRITSIADFLASRYGHSPLLGGLVALTATVGVTPYIALQLKAVAVSFTALTGGGLGTTTGAFLAPFLDQGFLIAAVMALFAIVFGARQIDAAEHHPGMVAAIALESLVKLVAFLAVGIFVVWGLHGGLDSLFATAANRPDLIRLMGSEPALGTAGSGGGPWGAWVATTILSAAAMLCLPRQFQVMVIESVEERHLDRAVWLFPLYLLLINLFVLPVALSGLLTFGGELDPDLFMVALPLNGGAGWLALLAFLGGLSAAAGMIVVESVALSTMLCNDLVVPILLRTRPQALARSADLAPLLLAVRRVAIVAILLFGYGYFRLAGSAYALVSIGLISFAAVAQFAPALIGGLYWRRGTRRGAIGGVAAGTLIWAYTLLLPSFARSGWLPASFIADGPWGIAALRPYALFGLESWDTLAHALFWTALANIGAYVGLSLFDRQGAAERAQAAAFVDVFHSAPDATAPPRGTPPDWRSAASVGDLTRMVARFLGPQRAERAFAGADPDEPAGPERLRLAERLLAGAIGGASARVALASSVSTGAVEAAELLRMLDETSDVIAHSRELERKTAELERATDALRTANERLTELDRLKDDFLSTVTHELRTPLTSIRALSEILYDDPDLESEQRQEFLAVIIKESERLTRLINQVLDMAKIEAGALDWRIETIDAGRALAEAVAATEALFRERGIALSVEIPDRLPPVRGDVDRVIQVVVNLLSNAAKFTPPGGRTRLKAHLDGDALRVMVADSGPGVAAKDRELVFDRFRQSGSALTGKPAGTGLGLAIAKRIVEHLGGRIGVEDAPAGPPPESGRGAAFWFTLPLADRAFGHDMEEQPARHRED